MRNAGARRERAAVTGVSRISLSGADAPSTAPAEHLLAGDRRGAMGLAFAVAHPFAAIQQQIERVAFLAQAAQRRARVTGAGDRFGE